MTMSGSGEKKERKRCQFVALPLTKVTTIMKSSPEVGSIGSEAVLLTAKAAELFTVHLATSAAQAGGDSKKLDYTDIANIVHSEQKFAFLKDIIPKRMPAHQYQQILHAVEEKESELGRYLTQEELTSVRLQVESSTGEEEIETLDDDEDEDDSDDEQR